MAKIKKGSLAQWAYRGGGIADPNFGQTVATNDLGSPKSKRREAHTAPTKFGMGDYYGTSHKNPIGKVRDATVGYRPVTRKQMGTPPKNLA
jgi:hypothetical protein